MNGATVGILFERVLISHPISRVAVVVCGRVVVDVVVCGSVDV